MAMFIKIFSQKDDPNAMDRTVPLLNGTPFGITPDFWSNDRSERQKGG